MAALREASDGRPVPARRLLGFAVACTLPLLVVAPVVALAMQPFSGCATVASGVLAAWTAVGLLRLGFP
jgi:hypothetical protein